jgi:hypothetical protein
MSSRENSDVAFERDVPTTAADLEALARARNLRPLTTEDYLEWLSVMRVSHVRRINSDSDEPFEL